MKTKLLLLALAIATTAGAQFSKIIELEKAYGVTPATGNKTLAESMTLEQAKVKFDDTFRRARECSDKLTDAQVMSMTLFEAAHTDALWEGVSLIAQADFRLHGGLLLSRNRIIWPLGGYRVTMPLEYAYNNVEGQGNGVGNIEYGGGYGATEIEPWLDRWQGNPRHIVVLRSFHHGSDNFFGYGEGVIIKNFRINGRAGRWHDPNRVITGVQLWDLGEASDFTDAFVYNCDTGINIVRGTPFTSSGCISVFSNNAAGLAITGGSTASIQTLSGDDNGRMVHVRAGYGRPASAGLHIGAVKSEWAIADPNQRTWKPNVWELEGWVRLHVGFFSHATGNVYQDALFVVKPDVNTSHIAIDDFRLFAGANLGVLLRDRVNREAWLFDNGWASGIQEFRWSSTGGGVLESWPAQATRIDYPFTGAQLGYLRGDPATGQPVGSFDRVNGLPSWSDVTGSSSAPVTPPSPCAYTYSAWGACVNGTQTRTVTAATPAGCSGTPVLSQPCTTAAPRLVFASTIAGTSASRLVATTGTTINASATWAGFASAPNGTGTTTNNTSFPWPSGTAARVVLLGVTFTNAPGAGLYPMITGSHVMYPDGRIFHRSAGRDTFTGVTVTKGVKVDRLELPVLDGVLTVVLGGPAGTGSAPVFTVEGIEVYQ